MRRKLVIILTLFLMFGITGGVAPLRAAEADLKVPQDDGINPTISQEKALESLQAVFPEIFSGKEMEAEFNENVWGDVPQWSFSLKGQSGPPFADQEIRAEVNAQTGEIINMNYNPAPNYYKDKPVALTREQAYPIAQKFLQKIQPDKAASLVLQEGNRQYYGSRDRISMCYSFYWNRQLNGIKVDWDNIIIGVDASTGKIINYSYTWHDGDFPNAKQIISPDELTAKLLAEIGLYPTYTMKTNDYESGELIPAYSLNSNCQFYDAQTGQALKQDGTKIAEKDKRALEQVPTPQTDKSQIESPVQSNNKIAPQVAKKTAEEFFKKMGINGELRQSGGGSGSYAGYHEEYWNYSLVENRNSHRYSNGPEVSINVNTGKVYSYENYNNQATNGAAKLSYADALSKAQEAIEKINPEKKNQLVLQKELWYEQEPTDVYNFNFSRLINGIVSSDGGIRIEINKQDGSLSGYWVNWHPSRVTAIDNMISLEKAQSIFKNQHPFELAYIFPSNFEGKITADPILVYRNAESYQIDALSGEMLDWGRKRPGSLNQNAFQGHEAAPVLSLLQENELLPAGAKPEEALTRRQALRILMAATRSYYNNDQEIDLAFSDIEADDPDRNTIQEAVIKGIISNQGKFNPNQNISREEMAVWIVKSLSYQDIARMKNAITVTFKDVSQITNDKLNYVGLVDGLGLFIADKDQNFRPKAEVTWSEMAAAATRIAAIYRNQGRY